MLHRRKGGMEGMKEEENLQNMNRLFSAIGKEQ